MLDVWMSVMSIGKYWSDVRRAKLQYRPDVCARSNSRPVYTGYTYNNSSSTSHRATQYIEQGPDHTPEWLYEARCSSNGRELRRQHSRTAGRVNSGLLPCRRTSQTSGERLEVSSG